jgi:hypothetical protein
MVDPTQASPAKPDDSDGKRLGKKTVFATLSSVIGAILIVLALGVGVYALLRMDSRGDQTSSAQRFKLDLASQVDVPSDMLAFTEQRRIDLATRVPTAIAATADGTVFVAGDSSVEIVRAEGTRTTVPLEIQPTCLAVHQDVEQGDLQILLGAGRGVMVISQSGEVLQRWPEAHSKSLLTGIAVASDRVFVADAGQRAVLMYSRDGQLLGTIGKADPSRQMPGFVIPSPYFDLLVDREGLLHVVNPGMRRVEAYNQRGELQSYWGQAGSSLPSFFGCCNPAHVSLLPDGRFVTSEKGIPRIKIYSEAGELQQVVAAPRQLGVPASALGDARGNQKERVFDVAVDGRGNVLVLDAQNRQVIVFQPIARKEESQP